MLRYAVEQFLCLARRTGKAMDGRLAAMGGDVSRMRRVERIFLVLYRMLRVWANSIGDDAPSERQVDVFMDLLYHLVELDADAASSFSSVCPLAGGFQLLCCVIYLAIDRGERLQPERVGRALDRHREVLLAAFGPSCGAVLDRVVGVLLGAGGVDLMSSHSSQLGRRW